MIKQTLLFVSALFQAAFCKKAAKDVNANPYETAEQLFRTQLLRSINELSIPPFNLEGNETVPEESEWQTLIYSRNTIDWYIDKTGLFEDFFIIDAIEGVLNTQNVQYTKPDGTPVSTKAQIKTKFHKISLQFDLTWGSQSGPDGQEVPELLLNKAQFKIRERYDYECCYAIEFPPAQISFYRTTFYEKMLQAVEKEINAKMKKVFPKITRHLLPMIMDLHSREKLTVGGDVQSKFNELYRVHEKERLETEYNTQESSIRWDRTMHISPQIKQNLQDKGYMPTKGISKRIYLLGAQEPKNLDLIGNGFLPEGTQYFFHNYTQAEEAVIRVSKVLETVGIHKVYESWKLIRPMAFRKDVWSKTVLWENGGILLDHKFSFKSETDWIDWDNDEMFRIADTYPSGTTTAVEGYTKYHPLMLEEIMEAVFRVQNREFLFENYWNNGIDGSLPVLALTSPVLAGEVVDRSKMTPRLKDARFMKVMQPVPNGLKQMTIMENSLPQEQQSRFQWKGDYKRTLIASLKSSRARIIDSTLFDWDDGHSFGLKVKSKSIEVEPGELHQSGKKCIGCNDYSELFLANQLFCDQHGPDCEIKEHRPNEFKTRYDIEFELPIANFGHVNFFMDMDSRYEIHNWGLLPE